MDEEEMYQRLILEELSLEIKEANLLVRENFLVKWFLSCSNGRDKPRRKFPREVVLIGYKYNGRCHYIALKPWENIGGWIENELEVALTHYVLPGERWEDLFWRLAYELYRSKRLSK